MSVFMHVLCGCGRYIALAVKSVATSLLQLYIKCHDTQLHACGYNFCECD